jgi:hypothetical protein
VAAVPIAVAVWWGLQAALLLLLLLFEPAGLLLLPALLSLLFLLAVTAGQAGERAEPLVKQGGQGTCHSMHAAVISCPAANAVCHKTVSKFRTQLTCKLLTNQPQPI